MSAFLRKDPGFSHARILISIDVATGYRCYQVQVQWFFSARLLLGALRGIGAQNAAANVCHVFCCAPKNEREKKKERRKERKQERKKDERKKNRQKDEFWPGPDYLPTRPHALVWFGFTRLLVAFGRQRLGRFSAL